MNVKDLVKVRGLSRKGQNRIHEHGQIWTVRKIWNGNTLLESTDGNSNLRWVDSQNDPDFEILRVLNPDTL